jgi:hypothetical protein
MENNQDNVESPQRNHPVPQSQEQQNQFQNENQNN